MNKLTFSGCLPRLVVLLLCMISGWVPSAAAQTAPNWLQTQRAANELRFLFTGSIERYDLSTGTWLGTVSLPRSGATAFTGDANSAFVAYGSSIYRYAPDFTGEAAAIAAAASSSIGSLFLDGDRLLAVHSVEDVARVTLFNRNTGVQADTRVTPYAGLYGCAQAPGLDKIFGCARGGISGDLRMFSYTAAGISPDITNSSYVYGFPGASRAFVFPDESRVIGTNGRVYGTADLGYKATLAVPVTDIGWNGTSPVVLSGTTLLGYSPDLMETGRSTLPVEGAALAVNGSSAFIFTVTATRPAVTVVPLSDLKAPVPGPAPDPAGLAFTPDNAFVDNSGNIVLLSREKASLFRWSPANRAWLSTIPLVGAPDAIAFSAANNAVYTAYPNQVLRKIDLSGAVLTETPWAALPEAVIGLAAGGDLIFARNRTSSRSFSAGGVLTGTVKMDAENSRWNTWDPVRRRLYHFRDGWSPDDLLYDVIGTTGVISASGESPYHGEYTFYPPLRVSPDGNLVVTGAGPVFNAADLTFKTKLPTAITDVVWKGAGIFTLRPFSNSVSQVQTWPGDFAAPGAADLKMDGIPFRLFSAPDGLVAVTLVNGAPRFTIFDPSLDLSYISPSNPLAPASLTAAARTVSSVTVGWADRSDNEDGFRVEYRPAGSSGDWTVGTSVGPGKTAGTVSGLPPGTAYEFRVVAFDGSLDTPSPVLNSATLGAPDEPIGEPYSLAVSRIYQTSLTLSWRDNASNETGFRIFRSTAADGAAVSFEAPAGATSWTDSGLTANTAYFYRIRAVNGALSGDLSAQVTARTLTADAVPTPPFSLAVSAVTATEATLTWLQNSLNEDEFIIESRLTSGTTYSEVARVPFNTTTYRLTGLTPNVSITVRVKASNAKGTASSSSIQITPTKLGGDYLGFEMRSGNIQYFAFKGPNRIERYDLAARAWLTAVPAQAEITALWVDDSAIFAAEGVNIIRWAPDGSGRTILRTAATPVSVLFTTGEALGYVRKDNPDSRITTLNKATGNGLSSVSFTGPVYTAAVDPVSQRVFLRGEGAVSFMDISPAGALLRKGVNEADYSSGASARLFVFPSGDRVVSVSGTVFSGLDLTTIDGLGGIVQDMAFRGSDVPVVLRGSRVLAYTSTLKEAGSVTLDSTTAKALAVDAGDAVVFLADGGSTNGMSLRIVPLSQLNAPEPGQPVNPNGLAFRADDLFLDRDGVIQVYSKALRSLIPWSPVLRAYGTPLPLAGSPGLLSYDSATGTLLTKYGTGDIRRMIFPAASPAETALVNVSSPVIGLAAAGEFAFVATVDRCKTYSPAGALLSDRLSSSSVSGNVWDPVRRRVYHLRDGNNPSVLIQETISADGRVTATKASDFSGSATAIGPVRVSPDGNLIFTGAGPIYNADDLVPVVTLPMATDAAWKGQTLFTISPQNDRTRLQSWSGADFHADSPVRDFPGTPLRVLLTLQGLTVITFTDGAPHFSLLNESLETVFNSPFRPVAPGALSVTGRGPDSVSLKWTDLSENEDQFVMEYRAAGSSMAWIPGGSLPPGSVSGTVSGLTPGASLEFRVRALDETLSSLPSAVVAATTLTSADQPVGEPYNLKVTRLFPDSVTLSWTDNAANETGFRILRSTTPEGIPVILNASANSTSLTDAGRTAKTPYYYQVQAVNGTVSGDLSAQITARTPAVLDPPLEPSPPPVISDVTATTLNISWKDNSLNEENFVIEYARTDSGTFLEAGRTPFNTTGFAVSGLSPDTQYYFRVRAVNASGGGVSSLIRVTTLKMGGEFLDMAQRSGNVYYFAFSGPDRLERYDLASRAWLTPVPAEGAITALWVDETAIYAGEDKKLVRWNPDGSSRTVLLSTSKTISLIAVLGEVLVFQQSDSSFGEWTSLDKTTGASLSTFSTYLGTSMGVDAAGGSLLIATDFGLRRLDISPAGQLLGGAENWILDFPPLQRLVVFPTGERVAGTAGQIYSTSSLVPSSKLDTPFNDLTFRGKDIPIVLHGAALTAFTNTLVESGTYNLGTEAGLRVAVQGTDALVFLADSTDPHGFGLKTVPLSAINAQEPDQTLDPSGLRLVDTAFIDRDGLLRLFSKSQPGLFTWSPASLSWMPTLRLGRLPYQVAYSTPQHRLYMAEASMTVRRLELASPPPAAETLFVQTPKLIAGLQTAGEFLYLAEERNFAVYSKDAALLQQSEPNIFVGAENTWDPVKRRMYHFTDEAFPGNLNYERIGANGIVTETGGAPSPAEVNFQLPIRVSPDGEKIVLGSGAVFNAADLTVSLTLRGPVRDAAWQAGRLVTLEPSGTEFTQVQRYTDGFAYNSFTILSGTPVRLLALSDGRLLAITQTAAGVLRIHLLDSALTEVFDSLGNPQTPSTPALTVLGDPAFNSQSGLWEQTIRVRNPDPQPIAGFEIAVTGLPAGTSLYNGSGATPSNSLISYTQPLAAGQEVTMLLQYYAPAGATIHPQLAVTAATPGGSPGSIPGEFRIDRAMMTGPGAFLVEFPAAPGDSYIVQYRDGTGPWVDSLVPLKAAGHRVQWIDTGTPRTPGIPGQGAAKSRFYRVKHLTTP